MWVVCVCVGCVSVVLTDILFSIERYVRLSTTLSSLSTYDIIDKGATGWVGGGVGSWWVVFDQKFCAWGGAPCNRRHPSEDAVTG